MSRSERNTLPGGPSNSLIRDVRRVLKTYLHCTPGRECRLWLETWSWADRIAQGTWIDYLIPARRNKRKRWPSASEIATQYIALGLVEMKNDHKLRLNSRAMQCAPPSLASQPLALPDRSQESLPLFVEGS